MLAGFLGAAHPLIDLVSHFQVPLLLGGVVLLAACVIAGSRAASGIALALCLVTAARVAPLWIGARPADAPAPGDAAIRVMSANVLAINGHADRFLAEVGRVDPDVLVVVEFSTLWDRVIEPLSRDYPFRIIERPADQPEAGVAVFSKTPLTRSPRPAGAGAVALRSALCDIQTSAGPVSLIALHAMAPVSSRASRLRDAQLAFVNSIVREAGASPLILAGDCNATPWSHGYRALVHDSGLRNARLGFGLCGSWRGAFPSMLRIPIDHVLVGDRIGVRMFETGRGIGSDHLPVIADLVIKAKPR